MNAAYADFQVLRVPQDLHTHFVYSWGDSSVAPEQTIPLIAGFRYAAIQGISDHLECFDTENELDDYIEEVRKFDLIPGSRESILFPGPNDALEP